MKNQWMLGLTGILLSAGALLSGCGGREERATTAPSIPAVSAPSTESGQAADANVAPAPGTEQEQPEQRPSS